ncbi:unnamed protein product [Psylliodes chrysocephalus]|uniref:Uncharacterized protein n=1 Tax=Psylliodes chrysocephalus TaxID=3402493 RepID=A0A9P0CRG4_9CUCU|nr:unnamed protein product [Psylliodes chrysocephala]
MINAVLPENSNSDHLGDQDPTTSDDSNIGMAGTSRPDVKQVTDHFDDQVPTTSNDSNIAMAGISRSDVEQVKRNIFFPHKPIPSAVFYNVLPYPQQKKTDSKRKRKKEYIPSVVTSDKWVEYHEVSERIKNEKEQQRQERKQAREQKKQMKVQKEGEKLQKKTTKLEKQNLEPGSSSEEQGDWEESCSSGDDIDFMEPEQENIEMFGTNDLQLGDFVLVTFKLLDKRSTTTYRYVAKILNIFSSEEYEIQSFKSAYEEKTVFYPIENDVSSIDKGDILAKLSEPVVQEQIRKRKTIFSGQVDIYEQI